MKKGGTKWEKTEREGGGMKEKVEKWWEGAGEKLGSRAKSPLMSYQKDGLISPLNCYSAVGFREMWGDFLLLYPHGCLCFGVYMEERGWRGSLKSGSRSRRLDWRLAVVIRKARQRLSVPSAFRLFFDAVHLKGRRASCNRRCGFMLWGL